MRALNILCGIAVLLQTLHLAHAMHHFSSHPPDELHGAYFWGAMALAVAMWILSFIGGILLLLRRKA